MARPPPLRRSTTAAAAATPPPKLKPVINLEEWDAKTQLSESALRTVHRIELASKKTPLPPKFSLEDPESSSRPSTPAGLRNKLGGIAGGSRPSTPSNRQHTSTHPLHPKAPIQTPQQFYDWYALIERSVARSQEAHFRAHLDNVSSHLATCEELAHKIDEVDGDISGMLEHWKLVEDGGKNLKEACERLLEERDRLIGTTEEIGQRLEYFQELEHATRMLNHPGESLVLQSDFLYMVERVDICIQYMQSHRHFREAELYLLRFQQCMTRAMTLIKMFFVGSLRALTADVTRRISEKDVSLTAQSHLLYTRFKTVANTVRPLLNELERRAAAHPETLSGLLDDCHQAYFTARRRLLIDRLTEEIRGLDPSRTELVELTRAGCSYLKQVCTDEFMLFRSFFNSGEELLYEYLEKLCDYLYDDLRPRILHEQRLSALCEVCTVLQALMVLDVPVVEDGSDDEDDEDLLLMMDPTAGGKADHRGLRQLQIGHLLEMVLQDAQTRLFFKAQAVIQSDIRYYVPIAEDLAYPDKLVGQCTGTLDARKPPPSNAIREKESVSELFHLPSMERRSTWYPTLERTVWVLSQLHDFVKPEIFNDMAHEAISVCLQSLVVASDHIKQRNTPNSALDGALFLVRHLLILKDMTNTLDLASRASDSVTDPHGINETLANVLGRTTSLLPAALFTSLGSTQGIDKELQRACEEVIFHCAEPICAPLRNWLDRARMYNQQKHEAPLISQDWATQPRAEELESHFRLACERDLRAAVIRMKLYLEDERTVGVLVVHAQERIVDEYVGFAEMVGTLYPGDMRSKLMSVEELKGMLWRVCNESGP
ncbi:Sec34-domain-containing protein [Punctularia strigosozonata HHB-11173 SS5]|uniref:Sec34-domain-containing protein n=1 Tax=Punctularia strigosozonata (strain HHB-11173) TaxID=741275 RepID=UPI0004417A3F|nr:Sec34-domain-containing protein [Punctularia strigosozonata HHB-11173 SS5]EIN11167.1 Sec34-domain-containing protein [Punctularia strigosozonata HHB-11173 SS5]